MKKFIAMFCSIIILAGCVSGKWVKSGASEAERKKDKSACKKQANSRVKSIAKRAHQAEEAGNEEKAERLSERAGEKYDKLYANCMKSKGWEWEKSSG